MSVIVDSITEVWNLSIKNKPPHADAARGAVVTSHALEEPREDQKRTTSPACEGDDGRSCDFTLELEERRPKRRRTELQTKSPQADRIPRAPE